MSFRIPPLALLVIVGALMCLLAPDEPVPGYRYRVGFGVLLILIGSSIALAGVAQFRRAKTTVDPRDPSKATSLVDNGIYGFTRNPMYLGFVLMLAGWALVLGSPATLALVALYAGYLDRLQIPPEEAALKARFGGAFETYCARVRR